ncbi:MAG: transcription elongation factor Elf1 [Enterobacterales bacterium]|jgi:transcription elongation factor Elf1
MNTLFENDIHCPYCGELISVLIDCSVDEQEYIEDCQVCCRPITFKVQSTGDEEPLVTVLDENEV